MKLSFKRSGGFAGISSSVNLDSDKLSPEKSAKLSDLLAKVPFKDYSLSKDTDVLADGFSYSLVSEDGNKKEELTAVDGALTDNMQDLFDFILEQD